eukprot:763580-Hanusia_phi.AAC.2
MKPLLLLLLLLLLDLVASINVGSPVLMMWALRSEMDMMGRRSFQHASGVLRRGFKRSVAMERKGSGSSLVSVSACSLPCTAAMVSLLAVLCWLPEVLQVKLGITCAFLSLLPFTIYKRCVCCCCCLVMVEMKSDGGDENEACTQGFPCPRLSCHFKHEIITSTVDLDPSWEEVPGASRAVPDDPADLRLLSIDLSCADLVRCEGLLNWATNRLAVDDTAEVVKVMGVRGD